MKPGAAIAVLIGALVVLVLVSRIIIVDSRPLTSRVLDWKTVKPGQATTRVRDYTIVREEFGGPAPEVKRILAARFKSHPEVVEAYLVDIDYYTDKNTACVFQVAASTSDAEEEVLIRQLMDDCGPIMKKTRLSLDVLPLRHAVPVPAKVKPFYVRGTQ